MIVTQMFKIFENPVYKPAPRSQSSDNDPG